MLMSTYEEFMVILTFGLLIVAILNLKNFLYSSIVSVILSRKQGADSNLSENL